MSSNITGFEVVASGTIYRTDSGLQGYYPRIVRLDKKEFAASFVAGTALETPDSHPALSRSQDGGVTWEFQGPIDVNRPKEFPPAETGFISRDSNGTLLCLGGRFLIDPEQPDQPLVNPKTLGMRENQIVFRRSNDGGRSWTEPRIIPKPIPVPLELPTGILALKDNTHLLSFSAWREWDGSCPFGHQIFLAKSIDGCLTWGKPISIFYDPTDKVGFWEGRITMLTERVMIATCWAHQWEPDQDLPNRFALSYDQGDSWTKSSASPVNGQTGWPLSLGGNKILFVYNYRQKPPGIRAQIALVEAGGNPGWTTIFDDQVWSPENQRIDAITKDHYGVEDFQFGAPSAFRLDEKNIMVVYWCVEHKRAGINWTIISLVEG